jgi:AcrR family transcriptional regulator
MGESHRTFQQTAVPWGLTADLSSGILLYRSRPTVGLKREKELMARIVKEHAVRRNEILDVAQRLVNTKGYEQMTIQDILDGLQISKGAFYHYFDSKQALLEAIIERMVEEVEQLILPIVHDPHLPALEKFQRFFAIINRYKITQKTFFLELLRVWYADDNAIYRQKLRTAGVKLVTPWLSVIIRQGIQEGVLTTSYPDQVGEVVLSLAMNLGDTLGELLLSFEAKRDDMLRIERIVAAYTDAVERVLGAPGDSLQLVDTQTLKEWFVSPGDNV